MQKNFFDKIQYQFMTRKKKKNCPESGIDRTYLNKIQATYDKPTASILCSDENLKVCSLNSGTKQEYSLQPLLFNIVLEIIDMAIMEETEIQTQEMNTNWKRRNKTVTVYRLHDQYSSVAQSCPTL